MMNSRGSKSASVGAALVLLMVLISATSRVVVVVESADTSIVSGPHCRGESDDKVYNDEVGRLIDILVDRTKDVHRESDHEHYKYIHRYPYADSGPVVGGATCDKDLVRWGCFRCLFAAKTKIKSGCVHREDGSVILGDCSLWFAKIRN